MEEDQRTVKVMKEYLVMISTFILLSSDIAHATSPPMVLTQEGSPPLIWAAHQNDKDAIFRLINNKDYVDLNETDQYNRTALYVAVGKKNREIITLLADAGADLNKLCGYHTALHLAVSMNKPEIVKLLLEKGANIESRDSNGRTVLHTASFRKEVVELLLRNRADVEAKDKQGRTPLHLYVTSGRMIDTVTMLLNARANIHAIDAQGQTPLHHAANAAEFPDGKQLSLIKLLIKHGASPNALDKAGKKPLDYAKRIKIIDKAVIRYLSSITKEH